MKCQFYADEYGAFKESGSVIDRGIMAPYKSHPFLVLVYGVYFLFEDNNQMHSDHTVKKETLDQMMQVA
ncbi:hypothetical protein [secondary endosymbiont of Ctenarytaina eucalypti]|uniref:Uncharacterized protein n=1 Tax=secondary endosymbiont of Ctenarytaina eucalypti TaxID=1199245 RepID=J3TXU0_9ENTR|nr:hypothetical protein [secondary endosymbiont of Ctenarytaina eucalypti]AFP85090.1 hypothetical protein A359_07160 [secondary endosymbiont of Ctenarytaina eucalypti]